MKSKKYFNSKAQMCYLEILVLILATFAFSYLISQSSAPLKTELEITKDSENTNIIKTIVLLIIQKIKQPILPMISAEESLADWACCEKNNNGNFCTYRPKSECNSAFSISPNKCEESNFCKQGCCVGSSGICSLNTAKTNCNGAWFEQASCNIQECKRGCCILGDESKFITEKQCQIKAGELGISVDFKNEITSEVSCLYLTQKQVQGACVLEFSDGIITTKNCIFTTSSNCDTRQGSFYANTFCSNSQLNTTCKAKDHTGCVEGKDEVYWLDSCGNREDVKEACSIFTGTRCGQYRPNIDTKPDTGDYVCRDLSCNVEIDGKVVNKKNGEAWCEYEGCIGNGKDSVGSRHVMHICYMGEEKTEACDDFRNQICVQSDTELADGSTFSEAGCRVNRWRSCYEYNNEKQGMAEKCKQNPDCTIKGVHIDKFNFDVCVPNYPPGFEFWNTEDTARNGELECSFATQTCTVIYVKRADLKYHCEYNCDCEKSGFTQQMNDLCISLGDCGGYINFNGDYTDDGYTVGRAGRINGNQYKYCSEYQPNQKPADPGNFSFSQILGIPEGIEGEEGPKSSDLGMWGAGVLGAWWMKFGSASASLNLISLSPATQGAIAYNSAAKAAEGLGMSKEFIASYAEKVGSAVQTNQNILEASINTIMENPGFSEEAGAKVADLMVNTAENAPTITAEMAPSQTATGGNSFLGFKFPSWAGNALASVGAGLSVTNFMQAGIGANNEVSYSVGGAYAAIMFFGPESWFGPMLWIGIAISLYSWIGGLGKTQEKRVTFTCMPWQPETGGLNCDLCNTNDPLGVPCSEYRCKSLGQTCEFINPRTEDEKCVKNDPNDISSPRIKPLYKNITLGYKYDKVSDSSFEIKSNNGKCVPEYTVLSFGIETDKPARCRVGTEITQAYDEMEAFGGKSSFLTEHKTQLAIPSPSAFKNRYNLTDEETEALGQINYFVMCENVNGISNTIPFAIKTCANPGPDLTAPIVAKVIPEIGYVKYGETEKEIQIYTNEPADCKWSAESNKEYDDMENLFTCYNDIEDYGLFGWTCIANLTGIDTNNKFYIKCKDQPWLPEENQSRNAMTDDYPYTLQVSKTPLIIEDFRPENGKEILSGVEPVLVEFKVKTSGGVDGTSTCKWEGNGYTDYFPEINEQFHIYTVTSATRGIYDIKFTCEDAAGNVAENSTSFKIKIDSNGPRITRMFYSGGLKIVTDENAECRYAFSSKLNWENSTIMSGAGLEHTSDWQLKNYYVQCSDEYGNKGGKIAIKPYSLI